MQDLSVLRKKRLLKVPKNLARDILAHPGARSIAIFLELKPLFVSSVIHNDNGTIPYNIMARYVGYSYSGFRQHFNVLKKLNLAYVDEDRNVHLSSYHDLKLIFCNAKKTKTFKIQNKYDVFHLLKAIAIHENLEQQKTAFDKKLSRKLALNQLTELAEGPYCKKDTYDGLPKQIGFYNAWNNFILTNETNAYLEEVADRFKKRVNKHKDWFLKEERGTYKQNYLYKDPKEDQNCINPFFSVTTTKTAEILNRKSASTGYYQQKILESMNLISIERETIKTNNDGANMAAAFKIRSNFANSQNYNEVRKKIPAKFRNKLYKSIVVFPNQITVNCI